MQLEGTESHSGASQVLTKKLYTIYPAKKNFWFIIKLLNA